VGYAALSYRNPIADEPVVIVHFGHGGPSHNNSGGLNRTMQFAYGEVGQLSRDGRTFPIHILEGTIRKGSSGSPVFSMNDHRFLGIVYGLDEHTLDDCYAVTSTHVHAFMDEVIRLDVNFTFHEASHGMGYPEIEAEAAQALTRQARDMGLNLVMMGDSDDPVETIEDEEPREYKEAPFPADDCVVIRTTDLRHWLDIAPRDIPFEVLDATEFEFNYGIAFGSFSTLYLNFRDNTTSRTTILQHIEVEGLTDRCKLRLSLELAIRLGLRKN